MTKKQEVLFREAFEEKLKEATYKGLVNGYYVAMNELKEQLEVENITLDEIKEWCNIKRSARKELNKFLSKGEKKNV